MDSPTKRMERVKVKDKKTGKKKWVYRRKKAYDHNGEFQHKKNRTKAQHMLKEALIRNGFTVNKWKMKSNYYGGMRKLSKSTSRGNCKPEMEVCRDKVAYYRTDGSMIRSPYTSPKGKGRQITKHYRISEHIDPDTKTSSDPQGDDYRTVGDHMHNKKFDEWRKEQLKKRGKKGKKGKKVAPKKKKGQSRSKPIRLFASRQPSLSSKITKSLNGAVSPLDEAKTITNSAFLSGLDKGPAYTKGVLSNLALATRESNLAPAKKQQIIGHIRNELDIRGMNSREVL